MKPLKVFHIQKSPVFAANLSVVNNFGLFVAGDNVSVKCQRAGIERAASKWSQYLDEEEEEEEIGLKLCGDENDYENVEESMVSGLIVKDEIHPDFI